VQIAKAVDEPKIETAQAAPELPGEELVVGRGELAAAA
jgi:hypothetical protein